MSPDVDRASARPVRAVVADDAPLMRQGVAYVLDLAGIEVVAQAGTGEELVDAVGATRPDVAVTDIRMPPTHRLEGLEAAVTIQRRYPATAVLLLSNHAETRNLATLLDAAVAGVGYLLKERVVETASFVSAVRRVAGGGTALDAEIVTLLLARRDHRQTVGALSPRERDVLAAMATGASNTAVSRQLYLSPKTVEAHIHSIFRKLGLGEDAEENRRVKAVLAYLQGT